MIVDWDRIDDILEETDDMPYGDLRYSIQTEALAQAQARGDVDREYTIRLALVDTTSSANREEELFVHLAWCRGMTEREPDRFPMDELIWNHKWAVTCAIDLVSIPLATVERLTEDLADLLQSHGYNLRPVYKLRLRLARVIEDRDAVRHWFKKWKAIPPDRKSDCRACDVSYEASCEDYMGRPKRALNMLSPILADRITCHMEPETSQSSASDYCLQLGWWNRGRDFLQAAEAAVRGEQFEDSIRCDLVEGYVILDDIPRAMRVWCDLAADTLPMAPSMDLLLVCHVSELLFAVAAESGIAEQPLRLHAELPYYERSGRYDTRAMAQYFHARMTDLLDRIDARNGNTAARTEFLAHRERILASRARYLSRAS